jgi:hypothetical protein
MASLAMHPVRPRFGCKNIEDIRSGFDEELRRKWTKWTSTENQLQQWTLVARSAPPRRGDT